METIQNQQVSVLSQLKATLESHQDQWSGEISSLAIKVKDLKELPDLMGSAQCKRQDALDYYYRMLNKLTVLKDDYNREYQRQFNHYKAVAQFKYTDTAINALITGDLSELIGKIELVDNHCKFMKDSIKTLDGIIYAITNRIKLAEITMGLNR